MLGALKRMFVGEPPQPATLRPFGVQIPVAAKQTVLEAALQEGVAFPHSCTVGTCASCKCKLVSGTVKARTDFAYTLSAEELQSGYILACQAYATSPLVIDVDAGHADLPPPTRIKGRLVAKAALTHDILQVTVQLEEPVKYVAGQFANLKFKGLPARSYSFADPPERAGRETVTFFIRKVPGGALTEALFAGALDDMPLELDGPRGNFHLRVSEGPLICICGGSGLAPLMSLLMNARQKNIKRRCVFFFGARTQADLYKLDAMDGIAKDWLADFEFVTVLSSEPADSSWMGRRGMVTDVALEYLQRAGIDPKASEAYMCGPPVMIDRAISSLVGEGVDVSNIHYDKFTDASSTSQVIVVG